MVRKYAGVYGAVALAVVLLGGQGAQAQERAASSAVCPRPPCKKAPEPASAGASFDEVDALFRQGRVPTAEELEGRWIQTLMSNHPVLNPDGRGFGGGRDDSDAQGLKNEDGSARNALIFSSGVSDWTGRVMLQVQILGLGEHDVQQGPYRVELSPDAACFSQFVYRGLALYLSTFFALECRIVREQRMICSVTPGGDLTAWGGRHERALNRTIGYRGYAKSQ
jgi:hypothetical protein